MFCFELSTTYKYERKLFGSEEQKIRAKLNNKRLGTFTHNFL